MINSNRSSGRSKTPKPPKPYRDFPLSPHASGAWCKRIRGKLHYFSRWGKRVDGQMVVLPDGGNWRQALELYQAQCDDLFAGRTPRRTTAGGLSVAELGDRYLTSKLRKLEAGELSQRSFQEAREFTDRVVAAFGRTRLVDDLRPDDFAELRVQVAKRWGPARLTKFIQSTRSIFKFAVESQLIEKLPVFGPEFKRPSKDVFRRHRAKIGPRLFTSEEIRRLLEAASVPMRAMILLGIGNALGNSDLAELRFEHLDLDNGWLTFPRPKTGVDRRSKLLPETVQAIRDAIAIRPQPKDVADKDRVFITKYGRPWVHGATNAVSLEFGKLLRQLDINHRVGLNFYSLRRTCRTVGDAVKDTPALRLLMGHSDSSIDDVYRQSIDDARLVAICEHMNTWLFGAGGVK